MRQKILLLLCLAFAASTAAAETLRVLSWPGYVTPEAVRAFEQLHKVSVELIEVASDEELWDRARGKADTKAPDGHYDVLAVNTAELQRYVTAELMQPVDAAKIPNVAHQTRRFRQRERIPGLVANGRTWAIPFTYSSMGLIYHRKHVSDAPRSMSALWDKRYRQRIALHNSGSHHFSLTALTLGQRNPFHLDPSDFRSTLNRLLSLRDNVPRFYATPEDLVALFREHDIALAFGNYGDQQVRMLQKAGFDVGYAMPTEGTLAWLDCWGVFKAARNKALAHAWINHMLTSGVASQLTEAQGLANTLREGSTSSARETNRLIWIEPVEDADSRARHWQRFMAGAVHAPRSAVPTSPPVSKADPAP